MTRKHDADAWDRQIERDIAAGRLDNLAEEARADHVAGKSRHLADALAEGALSGPSSRTIPDIIRDTKTRLGNTG